MAAIMTKVAPEWRSFYEKFCTFFTVPPDVPPEARTDYIKELMVIALAALGVNVPVGEVTANPDEHRE
jgi:hypothetical protein